MKISWDKIIPKISDKDPNLREEAAESLSFVKTKKSVRILEELLSDKNYNVRCAALNALSNLYAVDSLPKIIKCLNDKDELVRINAVECLGRFKNKTAIKVLIGKINDKSELVRSSIGSALGKIGDRRAKLPIKQRILKEKNELAKVGLFEGLYLLGDKSYLDKLIGLLASPDYHVRCSVAHILSYIVDSKNKNKIKNTLNKTLSKETTIAAMSSIINSLREIK